MPLVTEEIPQTGGCPILGRTKAFVVDGGTQTTLQFTFRDANGQPLDLYRLAGIGESASESEDDLPPTALLRIREPLAGGTSIAPAINEYDPIYDVVARLNPHQAGVAHAVLPDHLLDRPGLYEGQWAAFLGGASRPSYIQRSVLSIERTNFTQEPQELARHGGPPTLQEIRYAIWDSADGDNIRLRDYEYDADQILTALIRPVQQWNESLPYLRRAHFRTRNFPYREQWLRAVAGYLLEMASHRYLRNKLQGVAVDENNRDEPYLLRARTLLKEYQEWVGATKTSLSLRQGWGVFPSDYSTIATTGRWS